MADSSGLLGGMVLSTMTFLFWLPVTIKPAIKALSPIPTGNRVEMLASTVGVVPLPVMVKLASETSKKMLPTASTLMRAVLAEIFGTVTAAEPLLGVLATSTVGKVFPPSVESEIFTFAAL